MSDLDEILGLRQQLREERGEVNRMRGDIKRALNILVDNLTMHPEKCREAIIILSNTLP